MRNKTDRLAIISILENGRRITLTYQQLFDCVAKCAHGLKNLGISKGDRVVGFVTNSHEAVIAMLATTSLGAIWSSCSPDFGVNGVLDRFGQIEPKLIFACTDYFYNGKHINCIPRLKEIQREIKSLDAMVTFSSKSSVSSTLEVRLALSHYVKIMPKILILFNYHLIILCTLCIPQGQRASRNALFTQQVDH
ncbi:MAG: hypothetical protein CM15mP51_14670 [Porticoccaceae bacterium]|nr:MAG: hypothetical protein CM15mP51_14670 [Porticoccaceae bacterium]